jgi:hypothetical protein
MSANGNASDNASDSVVDLVKIILPFEKASAV